MMKERQFRLTLQRLALAVQGFRNQERLGKRKHRKLRRDKTYRELCLAWEEASELLDATGGILETIAPKRATPPKLTTFPITDGDIAAIIAADRAEHG